VTEAYDRRALSSEFKIRKQPSSRQKENRTGYTVKNLTDGLEGFDSATIPVEDIVGTGSR
jgi:hypothetical protein